MSYLMHLALSLMLLSSGLVGASCGGQNRAEALDVRQFVRQSFIHGVPFREASRYSTDDDVETLISMLDDRAEQFYWPNIVVVLGMGRNPRATQALIAFIESGSGKLSRQESAAKTSAIISLGYLASRDAKALDYLLASVNPLVWSNRLKWASPYEDDAESRNFQLTTNAIQGLGLSGQARAARALLKLQQSKSLKSDEADESFREVVAEALKTNEAVQKRGIEAYLSSQQRR